jgi:hypothetical protein
MGEFCLRYLRCMLCFPVPLHCLQVMISRLLAALQCVRYASVDRLNKVVAAIVRYTLPTNQQLVAVPCMRPTIHLPSPDIQTCK